jgi:hypothetical protein
MIMTILCLSSLVPTGVALPRNGNAIATHRCKPYQTHLVRPPKHPLTAHSTAYDRRAQL